ncbi:protein of unknown function DUF29 [Crinalium epipsammum PCC 9333]|uniref:DUF29 domain-containing protein n=1 Tax=Crinalium epipsammum PCC 9333 TaxID=1173022 RepID=K9W2D4_9CYAN|nr:DUF29 domain-containing protein [Crinalium epipsammum]AFZ13969.1 protein of unknown function DUF29 [Crinalium epipsammum PCC 9333]
MTTDLKLTPPQNLYKQDYYMWLNITAQQLRDRQFDDVDLDNLIEELEAMSGSQRRELKNRLIILLMHLLKYQYQPSRRSSSWVRTIWEQFYQIESLLEDSPSLKPYYEEIFNDCYLKAIPAASSETKLPIKTFPSLSPFFPQDVTNPDFIYSLVNQEEI